MPEMKVGDLVRLYTIKDFEKMFAEPEFADRGLIIEKNKELDIYKVCWPADGIVSEHGSPGLVLISSS